MTTDCPITHAKAYPFDIPDGSYVLGKDGWKPMTVGGHKTEKRHAVIASGSNASPNRLAAKYQDYGYLLDEPVYVSRATLHDFDSVYSAHISGYGSIPATLAHAPGAEADVFVTWLTDGQLARMHDTEAVGKNYDFARLDRIILVLDDGSGYTHAHAYLSRRGCLNHDGQPVSLAATTTQGRMWKAMSQTDVLRHARDITAPDQDIDTFIKAHIDCPDTRQTRTEKLAQTALDHGWTGGVKILAP